MPADFGQARMAGYGWIALFERQAGREDEFIKAQREKFEKVQTRRELTDWALLAAMAGNSHDVYLVLKKLSLRSDVDPDVKILYLNSLGNRGLGPGEEGVGVKETKNQETPATGASWRS